MTRACVLALAVAGCLAPAAVDAQTRVSTFRAPKLAVRAPQRRMKVRSRSVADSRTRVSTHRGRSGFRGMHASQPFYGGGGLGDFFGGPGAFGGLGGVGGFSGYAYDPTLLYRLGHIPVPPYYALHPPVYYSQPIPRTYGSSPYARWPGRADYDVSVQPATIINPHYKKPPQDSKEASTDKTASHNRPRPRLILNPYFEPLAQAD